MNRLIRSGVIALAISTSFAGTAGTLWDGFVNPPAAAKPHVWWHWMNGNVTKEGVTADLEAMASAGIGGAQLFDAGCSVPAGPLKYYTDEWFDMVKHAASEAQRLGLELCLPNCSGWSSSGGPWITPDRGMKTVVCTDTFVDGGKVKVTLPKPGTGADYYRDIAVLAVPVKTPAGVMSAQELMSKAKISSDTCTNHTETLEAIIDNSHDSSIVFSGLRHHQDFTLDFGEKVWSRGMSLNAGCLEGWSQSNKWSPFELFVSDDGKDWRSVLKAMFPTEVTPIECESYMFDSEVSARYWKIRLQFWLSDDSHISFRWWQLGSNPALTALPMRCFADRRGEDPHNLPTLHVDEKSGYEVPREEIVDVTSKMKKDGTLKCKLPKGKWRILRVGYGANGRCNHPASEKGVGLEVDKLNAKHLDYHFDAYMGKLMDVLGPLGGNVPAGLNNCLVDSYEVGCQNWTEGFAEEFKERMGYDLTPYLPAFVGVIIGSVEETDRFLWDYRRVVASLFVENYSKRLAEKCHERGLKLSLEPYGNAPCYDLEYGRWVDIPMGEFWWGGIECDADRVSMHGSVKHVASVANVWGQPIVATESFTAMPSMGRWMQGPWEYKPYNDLAYTKGVNRIIYHRYAQQPWTKPTYYPGMTMGPWGTHFERTVTWWNHGAADWLRYQARCQAMLQAGRATGGILQFTGDAVPNASRVPAPPYGYSSDTLAPDGLAALKVEDGALVAPSGIRYALLQLCDAEDISRESLAEIERLGQAGAKISAAKAPVRSFGLRDFANEAAFSNRIAEVFAKYVFKGTLEQAIANFGVPFDIRLAKEFQPVVSYIRKRTDDGTEIYFIASQSKEPLKFAAAFAPTGRTAELWDPATGERHALKQNDLADSTELSFSLDPYGSCFVVFLDPKAVTSAARPLPPTEFKDEGTLENFTVEFPVLPVAGAEWNGELRTVTMKTPQDWTLNEDPEIKYFSGTATYRVETTVTLDKAKSLWLDLGEVKNLAEVTVNGRTYPTLWKKPFRVYIGDAIGDDGWVRVEIKVTNFWVNRLIGDEFLPADVEWHKEDWGGESIVKIPDWVNEGKTSPNGRRTFTVWRHWHKDDPLLPSGLLGPVRLLRP